VPDEDVDPDEAGKRQTEGEVDIGVAQPGEKVPSFGMRDAAAESWSDSGAVTPVGA
jgi:hypothetical protein